MSTEARRASIPPRPTTPPRPAQPPTAGEEPGERMNDDSDWQAFGERSGRGGGSAAAARPTFGGFDWQEPEETDSRVPDGPGGRAPGDMSTGRESGLPGGGERSQRPAAVGRPPIRTTNGTDPGERDGSVPQQPRSPGAPRPGSIPPPPPASARFPDAPPAPGDTDPAGSAPGDRTPRPGPRASVPSPRPETDTPPPPAGPRRPAPGPMPPATSTAGAPASPSANPPTAAPGPMPPAEDAPARPAASGGASVPPRPRSQPAVPPAVPPRRTGAPAETASETTFRMRPVPTAGDGRTGAESGTAVPPRPDGRPVFPPRPSREAPGSVGTGTPPPPATPPRTAAAPLAPDPALSWSATLPPQAGTPGNGRPVVSFAEPEVGYRERSWGVRIPPRVAAVAACVVLGLGLIGGAVTGSWLIGDSGDENGGDTFAQARELWHSVPVDRLFPPTVDGQGAGPGGADRIWTRIAVAPDSGCQNAFDPLLRKALAPVGCERLLRATYTDATQSYVTTVGLLFTEADASAMRELDTRFTREGLDTRTDLMPLPYAAKNTLAAGFGAGQRASWTISVLTDAPVVAYAVSGWADGRTVDTPEPAEEAMESGDTTPAAQAGLGNEAQGLADRVERTLRKTVTTPPEQPS
ncbi:hypothetical protein M2163_002714 [Streptomyces sp. SAI-135]|uniref:hypothetical protein n=1 Tax=unclassified Streptomyces TaxID=2593676 RepID=UPI0024771C7E|nr:MULTISPECIES: hypothetical protein [unclassified Streptomyces]MDH6520304.1 hypothetical protein [Streptomyces sp. SAI-090]MDH6615606.1 hypothetical protein [Streptomyces sp. SAI-135]